MKPRYCAQPHQITYLNMWICNCHHFLSVVKNIEGKMLSPQFKLVYFGILIHELLCGRILLQKRSVGVELLLTLPSV